MKPYYQHGGVTIYHGDCREIMSGLKSVELVLTDPPYVNLSGGYVRDYQGGVGRKTTTSACVTDPWKASLDWLPMAWDKCELGMMVFCAFRSPGLKWDAFTSTVFDIPNINAGCMATERFTDKADRAIHPTQKPIALMAKLLRVSPKTVLDPFMGSGTTLYAAKQLGQRAIGIEIEEKYCEIAASRLNQEVMNFEG